MSLLLDRYGGITERLHIDEATQTAAIEMVADIEPIIERNKALYHDTDGYSPSREWKHVASIPLVVVEIWRKRYGVDVLAKEHAPLLKKLLNDPEWRAFRTSPGRL